MNFGKGIAILYSCFVIMIVSLVVFSFQQDFDLESENYYEKEINFGDEQKAINNFKSIEGELVVKNNELLEFHLPTGLKDDTVDVRLVLKKPDNAKLDKEFEFSAVSGSVSMPYEGFVEGIYNMEFSFEQNEKKFLRKKGIYILPR